MGTGLFPSPEKFKLITCTYLTVRLYLVSRVKTNTTQHNGAQDMDLAWVQAVYVVVLTVAAMSVLGYLVHELEES